MCNTVIDETEVGNFIVCIDCGAHAPIGTPVEHHGSCAPGDAKKWEKFYERANIEEAAMEADVEDKKPFITIYKPIAGWKAQLMMWEEDEYGGYWQPYQTSHWAYSTPAEAEVYAKQWAEDEGLKYVKPINYEYKKEVGYDEV